MSTSTLSPVPVAPVAPRVDRPAAPSRTARRPAGRRSLGRSIAVPSVQARACSTEVAQPVHAVAPVKAGTSDPRRELQLTRRGRIVSAALVLTVAVMIGAVSWGQAGGAAATPGVVTYETVTVEAGQSLWEIARAAAPAADTRATVSRIVDINDLPESGAVRAGQQITVPTAR